MTPVSLRGNTILRRLPAGWVTVAEIGVFVGTLSRFLLESRPNMSLIMVDSWATQDEQPETYRETGDRHALQTAAQCDEFRLAAKRRAHKYRDRVTILHMPSVKAAAIVADQMLDLAFIDADHSEQAVSDDIEAWLPKVKPGGWLGGHDYRNDIVNADMTGVERAVTQWANGKYAVELDAHFTWFCRIA